MAARRGNREHLHLAGAAGIPYEVLHSLTTADAPETVWHVRETFRRLELAGVPCDIDKHKQPDGTYMTMWRLIPLKLVPPTRIWRYCCAACRSPYRPQLALSLYRAWPRLTASF